MHFRQMVFNPKNLIPSNSIEYGIYILKINREREFFQSTKNVLFFHVPPIHSKFDENFSIITN